MLKAENLHFAYTNQPLLQGISLHLNKGEVLCLLGSNGAGKSTLLKILLGLLQPHKGKVWLNQQPLNRYSAKQRAQLLAYVPQNHQPSFPYTVKQLVGLGRLAHLGIFASLTAADKRLIDQALEFFNLTHLAKQPYTQLSGGERQLALIARAWVQEAKILILDEPLTGLDLGQQFKLLNYLDELSRQSYALLMTNHQPEQLLNRPYQLLLLKDGKTLAQGKATQVLTPENLYQLYGVRLELVNKLGLELQTNRPLKN